MRLCLSALNIHPKFMRMRSGTMIHDVRDKTQSVFVENNYFYFAELIYTSIGNDI